jgi:hypothetical protein
LAFSGVWVSQEGESESESEDFPIPSSSERGASNETTFDFGSYRIGFEKAKLNPLPVVDRFLDDVSLLETHFVERHDLIELASWRCENRLLGKFRPQETAGTAFEHGRDAEIDDVEQGFMRFVLVDGKCVCDMAMTSGIADQDLFIRSQLFFQGEVLNDCGGRGEEKKKERESGGLASGDDSS